MEKIKMSDVAEQIRGVSYKPEDVVDGSGEGAIGILRANNISDGVINFNDLVFVKRDRVLQKQILRKGDILICASSGSKHLVGKAAQIEADCEYSFGAFCKVVRPQKIDALFLGMYFQSDLYRKYISGVSQGANINNIKNEHIDVIEIPGYSNDEQVKIAGLLQIVIDTIRLQKEQIKRYDVLVKARFVEMFGDISRDEYKYETRKLGDVANVGSSHRVFTNEFVENGIPFYRGTEIGELANGQTPAEPYYIAEDHYLRLTSDETKPQIGDLLMPSICNKGQIWMVDTDKPFYYKDGRVLCISADRDIYDTKYLQYYMRIKTEIEYPKLGSGSTFAEFKIFLLKNLDILTPPRAIQEHFATFVYQVDKLKVAVQKALDEMQLLFDSLMQKYFG